MTGKILPLLQSTGLSWIQIAERIGVGTLLEAWQRDSGLSWKEVAAKLDVEPHTVTRLRAGRHVPLLETAQAIERLTRGVVPAICWPSRVRQAA